MNREYYITPEKVLIFQHTASLIAEINGKIQTKDTNLIISIHPTFKNQIPCFKASLIDSSFVEGTPFTIEWLACLESNNFGVDITEKTNGSVVYYFHQEQLLDAVIHSLTNDKRLKSQL